MLHFAVACLPPIRFFRYASVRRRNHFRDKEGQLNSSAYPEWRKALIELRLVHENFTKPVALKKVGEYLDFICEAAKCTWADRGFAESLKREMSGRGVVAEKGRKKAKKCDEGGVGVVKKRQERYVIIITFLYYVSLIYLAKNCRKNWQKTVGDF